MSNMSLCFQELTRWILLQCPHDGLIAMIHAYRSLHISASNATPHVNYKGHQLAVINIF